MSAARDAMVATARQLVGLTAPERGAGLGPWPYLQLVAPGDTPERQAQIGEMSGCILVRLGLEEQVYAVEPRGPYATGSAPRLLAQRAGGSPWAPAGALRLATLETPPGPGDAVWYGQGPGGPEHVETVVEVVAEGVPLQLVVVAGGQRTGTGLETIAEIRRSWTWSGQRWVCRATGRPVIAVIDADLLAERYGLRGVDVVQG